MKKYLYIFKSNLMANLQYIGNIVVGFITYFIVIFIFIATTNAVNLTDGLDGLAGSVSFIFLVVVLLKFKAISLYK